MNLPPVFYITNDVLLPEQLITQLDDERAGAVVCFEGRVRNHHQGRSVTHLEYEAYVPLAHQEGARIIEQAKRQFAIYHAYSVHRIGELGIGDIAVWVGVSSAHREAAFVACQFIIDTIKATLPIWKKEYYTDGTATWVNCETCQHKAKQLAKNE